MCIKNQQNALIPVIYFYCNIFNYISVSNLATFRVTFLLPEYAVIRFVKLLHSIEIHMAIR